MISAELWSGPHGHTPSTTAVPLPTTPDELHIPVLCLVRYTYSNHWLLMTRVTLAETWEHLVKNQMIVK